MTKGSPVIDGSNHEKKISDLMLEKINKIQENFFTKKSIDEDINLCIQKYSTADNNLVKTLVEKVNNNLISYFQNIKPHNGYKKWINQLRNIGVILDKNDSIENYEDEVISFENKPESFKQLYNLVAGKRITKSNISEVNKVLETLLPSKESKFYAKLVKDYISYKSKSIALEIYSNLPEEEKEKVNNWDNILNFEDPESLLSLARKTSLITNKANLAEEAEIKEEKKSKVRIDEEDNTVRIIGESQEELESTPPYSSDEEEIKKIAAPEAEPSKKRKSSNINTDSVQTLKREETKKSPKTSISNASHSSLNKGNQKDKGSTR